MDILTPQLFAALVLIISYALIVTERVHRTAAAMAGGAAILVAGTWLGVIDRAKYPTELHFLQEAVDWNTIGLLLGMMIIVGMLKDTGFFEFIAVKIAKLSRGNPWRIMLLFSTATAVLSAFLDNVTTVLLIAPVTVSIMLTLELNPVPFLISEVIASNIGGTATLIGDPPNIIIGSGAGLGFNEFILNLAPVVGVVFLISLVYLRVVFRDTLAQRPGNLQEVMGMNEWEQIRDRGLLIKCLGVLGMVIILFFLHSMLELEPSTVALFGAALLLLVSSEHPDKALHQVEWNVLLFFAGLFIIVRGVEEVGLIERAASLAVDATGGSLGTAMFVVLWSSAAASAVVDNIPFTATMVPLIHSMSASPELAAQIAQVEGNPLWWALSLGACLGGNATLIGASANVVVAGISERMGYPISFREYFRYAAPVTFLSLAVAGALLYVKTFYI